MDVLVEEPKLRNGRSKRTATPPRMAARPWCAGAPRNPGHDPYKEAAALTQPLQPKAKPTKRKSKAPSLPFAQVIHQYHCKSVPLVVAPPEHCEQQAASTHRALMCADFVNVSGEDAKYNAAG